MTQKKVINAGDFIVGEVDWNASLPGARDVLLSSALIDMYFSHGLTEVIKEFTRIQGNSRSVLDLLFLSDSMMLYPYECRVLPGVSVHLMCIVSLYLNDNPSARYEVTTYKDFSRADDVAFLELLGTSYDAFRQSSLDPKLNVNQLWQKFKDLATHSITQQVPETVKKEPH